MHDQFFKHTRVHGNVIDISTRHFPAGIAATCYAKQQLCIHVQPVRDFWQPWLAATTITMQYVLFSTTVLFINGATDAVFLCPLSRLESYFSSYYVSITQYRLCSNTFLMITRKIWLLLVNNLIATCENMIHKKCIK